jgi:hypothetical protein
MTRYMIWAEDDNFIGWCCSRCQWGVVAPRLESTVAALAFNRVAQESFEQHVCSPTSNKRRGRRHPLVGRVSSALPTVAQAHLGGGRTHNFLPGRLFLLTPPLKYAPLSMEMRWVAMSPVTTPTALEVDLVVQGKLEGNIQAIDDSTYEHDVGHEPRVPQARDSARTLAHATVLSETDVLHL